MLGVYVHIPFCNRICNYCDFCKILYNKKYIDKYLDCLEEEIKTRYKGEFVDSIYIGGGTPSSLDCNELDRLFRILSIINMKDNCEYTIECNIESIDIDKIILFKEYGINRVSFGVESFDKGIQEILGRSHDEDMIFKNISMTKKYIDNINIDLIYGVTNDIEIVKKDIDKFLELDIPHISCYSLILEENTKLYIDRHEYIDQDIDREMFDYIDSTLKKNGYKHYEVSNYSRDLYESIHNKNYWMNGEYYGFGLGAVSFIDRYRISNTKNMSKYLDCLFVQDSNYEDKSVCMENDLILGLRLIEGIDVNKYNSKYDVDILSSGIILELVSDGYLEVVNNRLRCKSEYIYLLNYILEKIIGSDL